MNEPLRLVLEAPQPGTGLVRTVGAKLYSPKGEAIPGIAKIEITIEPNDIVRATVTLNNVLVEYARPGEAP